MRCFSKCIVWCLRFRTDVLICWKWAKVVPETHRWISPLHLCQSMSVLVSTFFQTNPVKSRNFKHRITISVLGGTHIHTTHINCRLVNSWQQTILALWMVITLRYIPKHSTRFVAIDQGLIWWVPVIAFIFSNAVFIKSSPTENDIRNGWVLQRKKIQLKKEVNSTTMTKYQALHLSCRITGTWLVG